MTLHLKELIQKCRSKDLKAQGVLYQQYKNDLYVLSLKYCKNKEEAQDNLHDAFLEIFRTIKKYKGTGSFEGWMKRIVINKAIDRYKKEVFNNPINEERVAEESITIDHQTPISLDIILEAIQKLPSQYRLVFNLYEMDGYSHKEIAKMLSISEGTSKSNLHRAKVSLKTMIEKIQKQHHKIVSNGS